MPGEIPDLDEVATVAALSTFAQAQALAAQTANDLGRYVADTNLSFSRFVSAGWSGDAGMRGAPIGLLISTTAFRCRWLLINALTQGRLYLCESADKTRPVDNVDLWDRLQKPMGSVAPGVGLKAWVSMIGSQLIEQGDAHVWITDEESVVLKSRDGKKALARAFIPLPTGQVEPFQSKGFYSLDYWQVSDRISGRLYRLLPEEVVFLTYLDNSRDFFRGVGPMESCALALETDVLAASAANNSLGKGGLPQLLLMAKRPHVRQEELDAYLAEFRRQLLTARGAKAGVSMLSEAFDLEKLSQTFEEMGLIDLRRYAVEEITRAHGIQPCLVGQIDGNALSREILSVAHQEMFVDTVIPLGDRICEQLGALIHLYEPELDLCIAWDHVPALRGKLGEKLDDARKLWDMGATLEEAARAADIPELDADPAAIKTRWIGTGVKPMAQILGETAWQQRVAEERGVDGEDAVPPPTERLVDVTQAASILQTVQAYRSGDVDRESAKGVLVGLFGLSDDRAELVLGTEVPEETSPAVPVPPPAPGDPAHVTVPPDPPPPPVSTQGNDPGADPTVPGASPGASDKTAGPEPRAAPEVPPEKEGEAALETLMRAGLIDASERDVLAYALRSEVAVAALLPAVRVGGSVGRSRDIAKRIIVRSRGCERLVASVWSRAVKRQLKAVDEAFWHVMRRSTGPRRAAVDGTIELARDRAGVYSSPPAPSVLYEVAAKVDVDAFAGEVTPAIMKAFDAGLIDGTRELADAGEPLAHSPAVMAHRAQGWRVVHEARVRGRIVNLGAQLRAEVLTLLTDHMAAGRSVKEIRRSLRTLRTLATSDERFVADKAPDARQTTSRLSKVSAGPARDEAFKEYNDGRREVVQDAARANGKVAVFRWRTQDDDRVRTAHTQIEGEVRPYGESFIDDDTLRWPHDDRASVELVANCRCFTVRVGSIPIEEASDESLEAMGETGGGDDEGDGGGADEE